MKASYGWLTALVPTIKASPEELAERLTRAGLEVESIAEYGAGTGPILLAEVRKIEPHPKRDKLRLVTVDRGGAEQRVVCGASNVPDPGWLVALAPLGTTLPAVGLTLTPREIGGVVSEGMLCSERELGLSGAAGGKDEDAGILVFPARLRQAGDAAPRSPACGARLHLRHQRDRQPARRPGAHRARPRGRRAVPPRGPGPRARSSRTRPSRPRGPTLPPA